MKNSGTVYILTNLRNTVLYTGVTSDLEGRLYEHRNGITPGFASRYECHKCIYYEEFEDIEDAIVREKEIKSRSRKYKSALIDSKNPEWRDLLPSGTRRK